MRAIHLRFLVVLAACAIAARPSPIQAQAVSTASCSEGWSTLGALGITEFSCDCTFDRGSSPAWRFRGEPEIRKVSSSGPASGRLRSGDVIVAIDGMLITTRAAGTRLGNLRAGEPVTLTVRRGNREIEVSLVPDEPCVTPEPPSAPTPRAASPGVSYGGIPTPTPPRTPAPAALAPHPEVPPPPPSAPTGWFGFGISCSDCELNVSNHADIEQAEALLQALLARDDSRAEDVRAARRRVTEARRENIKWRFGQYPSLFSVDPGSPADDAGLRRGDVLLKIDGVSLLTAEGARRFSGVEPDQTVTWTFRRGGSEQTVRVRAIARPFVARAAPAENVVEAYAALERLQVERAQSLAEQADRLRETVDRAAVEARGESSQRELTQLRVELDRMNTTRSAATTEQLNKLREQLSLVERERAGRLTSTGGNQHLRFAGSVGNTEVEVRGLSSVEVSYDNSTGELLIRTVDSTIRVKAPVTNR
jgi:hypothetical protein